MPIKNNKLEKSSTENEVQIPLYPLQFQDVAIQVAAIEKSKKKWSKEEKFEISEIRSSSFPILSKESLVTANGAARVALIAWTGAIITAWLYLNHFKGHHTITPINFVWISSLVWWLLTLPRGHSHVLIDLNGIHFLTLFSNQIQRRAEVAWSDLKSIKVEGTENDIAKQTLVIKSRKDLKTYKIPMKKFMEPYRWQLFVQAVEAFAPNYYGLTGKEMDSLSTEADSSFTKLWLESLNAPPQRQRLIPLQSEANLQNGTYQIKEKLGTGGQGNAYLAHHPAMGEVVLKEFVLPLYVELSIRKKAIARFESEARILSAIKHPGIIKVFDTFIEDQRAYLVLERAEGEDLKLFVEKNGSLNEEAAVGVALELCEILKYLHTREPHLIHRDFTPDNLVRTSAGIKLIDFSGTITDTSETDVVNAAVVGKRHYMPPEQFAGHPTTISDIYALGCTLFYLLTGEEPEPMTESHVRSVNPAISEALDGIIARATKLSALERFQSVLEMETALRELGTGTAS